MTLLIAIIGILVFGAVMFGVLALCMEEDSYHDCRWGDDE